MFLVFIFLILSALGSHFFPDLSSVTVLLSAFLCVAALRLLLLVAERNGKKR